MFNRNQILIVAVSCVWIAMGLLNSCGRKPFLFGGIVDNGNQPDEPGTHSTSNCVAAPKVFDLFDERYEITLSSGFSAQTISDVEEVFRAPAGQWYVTFKLVPSICQADEYRTTSNGMTVFRCIHTEAQLFWVVRTPLDEIIEVRSNLASDHLDAVINTMIKK